MLARLLTRAPAFTRAFTRANSSSSSSRILQMAAQAERPSATEVAVPALWAACGVLTYTVWNRMDEGRVGDVEALIVV